MGGALMPSKASASMATEIVRQRPRRSAVGNSRRRKGHKFAAAVLNCGNVELVVLSLAVEVNTRSDAGIVGDVGGADGLRQRFGIGGAGALVGVGRNQQRLERKDMIGTEVDAWGSRSQCGFKHSAQSLMRVVPRREAYRAVGYFAERLEILILEPAWS